MCSGLTNFALLPLHAQPQHELVHQERVTKELAQKIDKTEREAQVNVNVGTYLRMPNWYAGVA